MDNPFVDFLVGVYAWSMGLGLLFLALWAVVLLWRNFTEPEED